MEAHEANLEIYFIILHKINKLDSRKSDFRSDLLKLLGLNCSETLDKKQKLQRSGHKTKLK